MKIKYWNKLSLDQQQTIIDRYEQNDQSVVKKVAKMIATIKAKGNDAIYQYEREFSNNSLKNFSVTAQEYTTVNQLSLVQKQAIKYAYNSIHQFALLQKPRNIVLKNNTKKLIRTFKPIENVGIYVPGGSAPLVSTLLMTGTLAKIAGCKNIVVCTPLSNNKKINPAILYAAKLIGINKIYKIGGVQAICAMGFGLANVQQVNKIFGPGNQYVAEAKKQIVQIVKGLAIDLPAGPSEVMVIADQSANPIFSAADLLAQAEHIGGRAILLTNNQQFAQAVIENINRQKQVLSKQSQKFINANYIDIIVVKNIGNAIAIANQYAPEHLMLQIEKPEQWIKQITNAGSVFVGNYSSEAFGDYVSGTNHVLPTNQSAKCYSGLTVAAFMKSMTIQTITEQGLIKMCKPTAILADLEGLDAHKQSVLLRYKTLKERIKKWN